MPDRPIPHADWSEIEKTLQHMVEHIDPLALARKIVAEHLQKGKVVDGLAVGKKKEPEQAQ